MLFRSRHHRSVALGAVLVLIIPVAIIGASTSVLASDNGCTVGNTCLYEHSGLASDNSNGCKYVRDGGDTNFNGDVPNHTGCDTLGGDGFNDDASAARNRDTYAKTLCGDTGLLGGVSANLNANTDYSNLPNNDTASSMANGTDDCI